MNRFDKLGTEESPATTQSKKNTEWNLVALPGALLWSSRMHHGLVSRQAREGGGRRGGERFFLCDLKQQTAAAFCRLLPVSLAYEEAKTLLWGKIDTSNYNLYYLLTILILTVTVTYRRKSSHCFDCVLCDRMKLCARLLLWVCVLHPNKSCNQPERLKPQELAATWQESSHNCFALVLKTKVIWTGNPKTFRHAWTSRNLPKKHHFLPWEFGSGSVSLATKCMTVVRPGGNFRAVKQNRVC